jgi:hypothetical protein
MAAPYYYDYTNKVMSCDQPANLHVLNTETGRLFQRYLLKKAMGVFEWSIPEWWDKDYFLYVLYTWGFVGIFDSGQDLFGVIPQQCGLRGYNVFWRPKDIVINNPLLPGINQREIDVDCVVMKLQPDYSSIMDIVSYYAELMAQASAAISQNFWNTHLATVFFAENDAQQQSIKKAYDKMSGGEPMVVVNKNLMDPETGKLRYDIMNRDVKQSYVIDQLLSDLRRIEAEYDTRIGIPNANTDKRERLITDEVDANNVETHILADAWMDNIRIAIKKIRAMFGIDISCDWMYKEDGNISKPLPVRDL